ncbi:hypothetical protein KY285_010769 [Solanum tuberosum]|nr:hypothetical protein KY289_011343 [Solanum tuberosum]KAH0735062.1 hypothetical protein KY285_010769 [Solanum tuberosum]
MQFLITLGLVETLFDPSEDRVKRDLIGETTIKRSRVELVLFNEDMVDATVRDGVNIGDGVDVGGGICASAGVGGCIGIGVGIGDGVGVTSCSRCSGFLSEKCKKHDDNSIMYLQTLSEAVNEFKYKREGGGVRFIPSSKVRIHILHRPNGEKKSFIKAIHNLKKKYLNNCQWP